MNPKLEKIKKLRQMTQANGCSEGEEDSAARAIGRMLMEDPALILGDGSERGVPFHVSPFFPPGSPWASAYQESFYAAAAQQQATWNQYRAQQEATSAAMRDGMARAAKFAQDMRERQQAERQRAQEEREEFLRKMKQEAAK